MLRVLIVTAALALVAPAAASAQTYPEPKEPGKVQTKPKGPNKTHTVCKKRYLRLIGNPSKPEKVLLRARGAMQNAFWVNEADQVTIDGFMARDYKANGFFFTNLNGYSMNHLVARRTGVYGLYAFNTVGGRILNSEAYYVNDGSFYIGQTPPQAKPVRTIVSNVEGWGSPLGFSATNMRYVTITKSRFYNNAAGIVPNALDSEKFPPPEENAIVDNDIFWNNFNFHRGNLLAENPGARSLQRNVVRNNQFGMDGTDANGTDLMYDGSGRDNCFSLEGVGATFPADRSTFGACGGPNPFSKSAQDTMLGWVGEGALKAW